MASTSAAREAANAKRFLGGAARVCTPVRELGSMGVGIGLYFKLLKAMALFFCFASVLSLPAILSSAAQRGLNDEQRDALGLGVLSLGNQGLSADEAERCLQEQRTTSLVARDCNGTTVSLELSGVLSATVDARRLASVLSLCDLGYSLAFLLLVLWLRRDVDRYVAENDHANLTGSDFAVFVRGLPPDATEREIARHFAARYDSAADAGAAFDAYPHALALCCDRPIGVTPPSDAVLLSASAARRPVQDASHLSRAGSAATYLGTAVADVSVGRSNAALLCACLHATALARKRTLLAARLAQCREKADAKRTTKAEAAMAKLDVRIAKAAARLRLKQLGKEEMVGGGAAGADLSAAALLAHGRCECAFVVFNSDVAAARALDDYRGSASAVWRLLFQPASLRFRGGKHRLVVERAPEPTNILWENLQMLNHPWQARARRAISALVTFLVILVSFALAYTAQQKAAEFRDRMPQLGLCRTDIPAAHFGRFADAAAPKNHTALVETKVLTASLCASGEYHLTFRAAAYDSVRPPGATHALTGRTWLPKVAAVAGGGGAAASLACTGSGNATLCDARGNARGCVSPHDKSVCCTLSCFGQQGTGGGSPPGKKCAAYRRSDIVGCFCKDRLQAQIKERGFVAGVQEVIVNDAVCSGFAEGLLLSQALIFGSALAVALVNALLKAFLTALSRFERHPSLSKQASSAGAKIFLAQFLNTAIIVLLVNARMPPRVSNPVPSELKLLNGHFQDFSRQWYSVVGVAVSMTLMLNIFLPHAAVLVQAGLFRLKRCWAMARHGHTLTQEELDLLWAWPQFEISSRLPALLNTIFCCLLYSAGVPLLMPFAFFAIAVTLLVDKLAITRLYALPPAYDETLARGAIRLLPYALLCHLGMACWMFSNDDLLKSDLLDPSTLMGKADLDASDAAAVNAAYREWLVSIEGDDPFGISGRIARWNVLPHFVFFVLLLATLLVDALAGRLLYPVLRRVCAPVRALCASVLCFRKSRRQVQPSEAVALAAAGDVELRLGSPNPDLTAPLAFAVAPNATLSKQEVAAGWTIGVLQGQVRKYRVGKGGEVLRTWQGMAQGQGMTPGHSYDLLRNVQYAEALALLDLPQRDSAHGQLTARDEVRPAEAVA